MGMSEYPLEDMFVRTFTPDSTVWDYAEWSSRRYGLSIIEDLTCPKGQIVMIYRETISDLAPGVYVHPSAKHLTLRENTAAYKPFDPTVKAR